MSNLNTEQQYILSLLKEISGLKDQNSNLKLEVQAVRQNSEEDAKHFHKLRAENRELAEENQALTTELDR